MRALLRGATFPTRGGWSRRTRATMQATKKENGGLAHPTASATAVTGEKGGSLGPPSLLVGDCGPAEHTGPKDTAEEGFATAKLVPRRGFVRCVRDETCCVADSPVPTLTLGTSGIDTE